MYNPHETTGVAGQNYLFAQLTPYAVLVGKMPTHPPLSMYYLMRATGEAGQNYLFAQLSPYAVSVGCSLGVCHPFFRGRGIEPRPRKKNANVNITRYSRARDDKVLVHKVRVVRAQPFRAVSARAPENGFIMFNSHFWSGR